jgi:hypothetical protein
MIFAGAFLLVNVSWEKQGREKIMKRKQLKTGIFIRLPNDLELNEKNEYEKIFIVRRL